MALRTALLAIAAAACSLGGVASGTELPSLADTTGCPWYLAAEHALPCRTAPAPQPLLAAFSTPPHVPMPSGVTSVLHGFGRAIARSHDAVNTGSAAATHHTASRGYSYAVDYGHHFCLLFTALAGHDAARPTDVEDPQDPDFLEWARWSMATGQCLRDRALLALRNATDNSLRARHDGHSSMIEAADEAKGSTSLVSRCEQFEAAAVAAHARCYVRHGFCDLSWSAWWRTVAHVGLRGFDQWATLREGLHAAWLCFAYTTFGTDPVRN